MLRRIALIFFVVLPRLAFGAVEQSSEHAVVQMKHFSSADGEEIALQIVPKKGWYVHSAMPGEFGMPAKVIWNNENVEVLNEEWSDGEDVEYQGFGLNVYKEKGLYAALIKPKDYGQKSELELSFMACKDECFPEKLSFEFWLEDVEKTDLPAFKKAKNIFCGLPAEMLLFAFLGGLILNVMPCVFPVLFIKILGLMKVKNRRQSVKDAVLYLLGVVFCFLLMALILLFLKSHGQAIGWGFQLQSPVFLLVMIALFFVLGLMFLDVISLNLPIGKMPAGSFFMGLLAVLVASPCTAPFMGAAIGWSLTAKISGVAVVCVFLALGLGYALPFFVAGFFPELLMKILPRPGKWMLWIKRIFAIPMFLTCLWLLWVLSGSGALSDLRWQKYDEEKIQKLIENKEKFFVDFSAKWCITCLANEKVVLDTKKFFDLMDEKNIQIFKADWTDYNPKITEALSKFGRVSVPLYVFFDGENFVVLPQIVTYDRLLQSFDGRSFR